MRKTKNYLKLSKNKIIFMGSSSIIIAIALIICSLVLITNIEKVVFNILFIIICIDFAINMFSKLKYCCKCGNYMYMTGKYFSTEKIYHKLYRNGREYIQELVVYEFKCPICNNKKKIHKKVNIMNI